MAQTEIEALEREAYAQMLRRLANGTAYVSEGEAAVFAVLARKFAQ